MNALGSVEDGLVIAIDHCAVCHGSAFERLPTPGHWIGPAVFEPVVARIGLNRCRQCGFCFVNPRPDSELLNKFYSGDDYSCHDRDSSAETGKKADFILDLVEKVTNFRKGMKLLDFGCGGGFFLSRAVARGWDAYGFDVGQKAVETCVRHGLNVTSRFEEFSEHKFDVVTLNHVFEHLEDHERALTSFKEILAANGRVFIEVPNVRSLRAKLSPPWCSRYLGFDERFRAFPIHLSYFSRGTLTRLLEQNGFEVEKTTTIGIGLEELWTRHSTSEASQGNEAKGHAARRTASKLQKLKQKGKNSLKRAFYSLGQGENLAVIAKALHANR
jgi:2-polyprenyl-3-methyl-5-hydroxy-6-metoxy-1,4-benzoquinol methylase